MKRSIICGCIILVLILFYVYKSRSSYSLTPVDKGNVIVYGSKTCSWCIKQEKYLNSKGIPYIFTDCANETCPDFVKGFPTLSINNVITSGYSEI